MIRLILESKEPAFRWVDVVDPTTEELNQIAAEFGLHATSVQDCLDPEHLPKFELIENTKFFIIRAFDESSTESALSIQELTRKVAVFLTDKELVSIHRKEQPFIKQLIDKWSKYKSTSNNRGHQIFFDILKHAVMTYYRPLHRIEENLENYERDVFGNIDIQKTLGSIYILKQRLSLLKRLIRMLNEVIHQIEGVPRGMAPVLQDLREEGNRAFFEVDEISEDATNLMSVQLTLASHRTNEVVRVLTLFSVFFMPLTFIVGVYGMNFKHMPELELKWAYPAVWAAMIGVCAGLFAWFWRKGWLKR